MSYRVQTLKTNLTFRLLSAFIAFNFTFSSVFPLNVNAQSVLSLPIPGSIVTPTAGFTPVMIKGVNLYPNNPLKFDFIIDKGEVDFTDDEFEQESTKLIKYFLSSLTVPEDEMWVNLSPYEKDRIVPKDFGQTEMGRDLLAQDYMLKQLTASLMNPDDELGGEFWQRVYSKAQEKYGTTDIPMNTFNKVWIVPEKAVVYEHEKGAFVVKSHLKVMLEEDYLALEANKDSTKHGLGDVKVDELKVVSGVQSEIIKDLLIPEIEREVNEGKTFANLRQIYNAVILASWYKGALKESLLGQVYVDQKKTKGVETDDKEINEKIYNQYVESFKKGVYNYIKEDYNSEIQEIVNKKYFSGGAIVDPREKLEVAYSFTDNAMTSVISPHRVSVDLATLATDAAQLSAVRRDRTGFRGAREKYLAFAEAGSLFFPEDLETHRHTKPWPLDMKNGHNHVVTYSGDNNYGIPTYQMIHPGIDILASIGTDVYPVEDGRIIDIKGLRLREGASFDPYQEWAHYPNFLVDITIYSPQSNVIWHYVHLDPNTLPNAIREFWLEMSDLDIDNKLGNEFNFESGLKVTTKDSIGKIAQWKRHSWESGVSGKYVEPDVRAVHGKDFNHLELSAQFAVGGQAGLNRKNIEEMPYINPTLLLRQLYAFEPKRVARGKKVKRKKKVKTLNQLRKRVKAMEFGEIFYIPDEVKSLDSDDVFDLLELNPQMRMVNKTRKVWIKEKGDKFKSLEYMILMLTWGIDAVGSPESQPVLSEIEKLSSVKEDVDVKKFIKKFMVNKHTEDLIPLLLLLDKTEDYEEVLGRLVYINGDALKTVLKEGIPGVEITKEGQPRIFKVMKDLKRKMKKRKAILRGEQIAGSKMRKSKKKPDAAMLGDEQLLPALQSIFLRDPYAVRMGISAVELAEELGMEPSLVEADLRSKVELGEAVSFVHSVGDEPDEVYEVYFGGEMEFDEFLEREEDFYRGHGGERFLFPASLVDRISELPLSGEALRAYADAFTDFFGNSINHTLEDSFILSMYAKDYFKDVTYEKFKQTIAILDDVMKRKWAFQDDLYKGKPVENHKIVWGRMSDEDVREFILDTLKRINEIIKALRKLKDEDYSYLYDGIKDSDSESKKVRETRFYIANFIKGLKSGLWQFEQVRMVYLKALNIDPADSKFSLDEDADKAMIANPISLLNEIPDLRNFWLQFNREHMRQLLGRENDIVDQIMERFDRYGDDIEGAKADIEAHVISFLEDDYFLEKDRPNDQRKFREAANRLDGHFKTLENGSVVVDVGAGAMHLTKLIATNNPQLNFKALDIREVPDQRPLENLTFYTQEKRTSFTGVEDGSVDLMLFNLMLHHVLEDELDAFLKEARRKLKVGGKIILVEDTYSLYVKPDQSESNTNLTTEFLELIRQHGEKFAKGYLYFNDWYANHVIDKLGLTLDLNFNSMEYWQELLKRYGFTLDQWKFIGFSRNILDGKAPRGVLVFQKSKVDNAQMSTPGGIDFNPTMINTEIKRNGRGVIIPTFKEPAPNFNRIEGFVPNIINVTPINNLQLLLGLEIEKSTELSKRL